MRKRSLIFSLAALFALGGRCSAGAEDASRKTLSLTFVLESSEELNEAIPLNISVVTPDEEISRTVRATPVGGGRYGVRVDFDIARTGAMVSAFVNHFSPQKNQTLQAALNPRSVPASETQGQFTLRLSHKNRYAE
jgi:hypothetical protein